MKWIRIVNESKKAPHDSDTISQVFNGSCSNERYLATIEFAKSTYQKMNKKLFLDILPSDDEVEFILDKNLHGEDVGDAICSMNKEHGIVEDFQIVLSANITLTLHEWMETILHEMIHIYDYYLYTKKHFNDPKYDPHGDWFLEQAKKFKKWGFDIKTEYEGIHGMDDENDMISNEVKRGLFIQTGTSDKGYPLAFKIDSDDKDEILRILREKGYDEITILSTGNLCSAEISPIVPHGVKGTKIWVYPISPEFNEQYGPFEEVEKMDLRSFVSEDVDDEHDDTFNVLRQIKGLSVKKLGNGKYRLKLS